MKQCIKCGQELEDFAVFCSECGESQIPNNENNNPQPEETNNEADICCEDTVEPETDKPEAAEKSYETTSDQPKSTIDEQEKEIKQNSSVGSVKENINHFYNRSDKYSCLIWFILAIAAIVAVEFIGISSKYNDKLYYALSASYIIVVIISIVILLYFIKSVFQAVFSNKSIKHFLSANFAKAISTCRQYKKYFIFFSTLLIVFNIQYNIVYSGINSQIGSIFEPPTFTAKYEAVVTCTDKGSMQKSIQQITKFDNAKIDVVVDKASDTIDTKIYQDYLGIDRESEVYSIGYYITAIDVGRYTMLVDSLELKATDVGKTISFTPVEIYRDNALCDIKEMPTYTITLHNRLLENLSYKGINIWDLLPLIIYVLFVLAYTIHTIYLYNKNKKAFSKAIISSAIALALIILPVIYISLPSVFGHTNYTSIIDRSSNEYCLNNADKIIHYKECPILDPRGIYTESYDYESAKSKGYTSCAICNP